jgi:hypothetical protein
MTSTINQWMKFIHSWLHGCMNFVHPWWIDAICPSMVHINQSIMSMYILLYNTCILSYIWCILFVFKLINVIQCMDNNKCMVLINIDLLSGAHSMKLHSEKTTSSRELANVQHRWGHISLVRLEVWDSHVRHIQVSLFESTWCQEIHTIGLRHSV